MSIQIVKDITEILVKHDLAEIRFEDGATKVSVIKSRAAQVVQAAPVAMAPAVAAPAAQHHAPAAAAKSAAEETVSGNVVKSPMIGVIYTAATPDAPPYAKAGDRVEKDQTLFLIEAMKTFNPVKSPFAGTVKKIMEENASAVEYDQPLLVIE